MVGALDRTKPLLSQLSPKKKAEVADLFERISRPYLELATARHALLKEAEQLSKENGRLTALNSACLTIARATQLRNLDMSVPWTRDWTPEELKQIRNTKVIDYGPT